MEFEEKFVEFECAWLMAYLIFIFVIVGLFYFSTGTVLTEKKKNSKTDLIKNAFDACIKLKKNWYVVAITKCFSI